MNHKMSAAIATYQRSFNAKPAPNKMTTNSKIRNAVTPSSLRPLVGVMVPALDDRETQHTRSSVLCATNGCVTNLVKDERAGPYRNRHERVERTKETFRTSDVL